MSRVDTDRVIQSLGHVSPAVKDVHFWRARRAVHVVELLVDVANALELQWV